MKPDFVLIAKSMLDRHLSYKSALIKCRSFINSKGTSPGDFIANMLVDDVKEAVSEQEQWKNYLRKGGPGPFPERNEANNARHFFCTV